MSSNGYILLGILQSHAPTGADQLAAAQLFNDLLAEGITPDNLEVVMVNILADGLNDGNWPWNEPVIVAKNPNKEAP